MNIEGVMEEDEADAAMRDMLSRMDTRQKLAVYSLIVRLEAASRPAHRPCGLSLLCLPAKAAEAYPG